MEKKESEMTAGSISNIVGPEIISPLGNYLGVSGLGLRGPVADPGPYLMGLLNKKGQAEIMVRQYDTRIGEMRGQIAALELARNLLIEEYGIDHK